MYARNILRNLLRKDHQKENHSQDTLITEINMDIFKQEKEDNERLFIKHSENTELEYFSLIVFCASTPFKTASSLFL